MSFTRYYVQIFFGKDEDGYLMSPEQLRQGEYRDRRFSLRNGPVLKLTRAQRDKLFKAYESTNELLWNRVCDEIAELVPEPWKTMLG